MRIGILGTGIVGKTLGGGFLALGHEVMMGARSAQNEKAVAWAAEAGAQASAGTFDDAARFGELVVLATLGTATEEALRLVGPANLAGKTLIDTTNPLDFSGGMPPALSIGHTDSLGERVQRAVPAARVVKAFNTVGSGAMFRPGFASGVPDMLICGNDADAKRQVTAILESFGWGAIDLGGIERSRYLEPMCLAWVLSATSLGQWKVAFKLLRE